MKVRSEEERTQFLKEQDGWTEFKLESVTIFGRETNMTKCTKCGTVATLHETKNKLLPLHCIGCGRTILKQDYIKFEM